MGVVDDEAGDRMAVTAENAHDVREVFLALVIGGGEPLEHRGKARGVKGVHAGIDLTDREHLVGGEHRGAARRCTNPR